MGTGLYGGTDMARVMYGENARHVPAWMYVQDQGAGIAGLVGASKVAVDAHPLRYGTGWPNLLVVGEIIVRPHIVWGTSEVSGFGAGGLFLGPHDDAFRSGELVVGTEAMLRRVREQWEDGQ